MVSTDDAHHSSKLVLNDISRNDTHAAHEVVQANRDALNKMFHKDHEHLHQLILLCLLVFVLLSQIGLHYWRKTSPKSFNRVSLAGIWIVPLVMSVSFGFWRMVLIWSIFSFACARVILLARARPMNRTTPKRVYQFFLATHQISYSIAVAGYILLVIEFLGVGALFPWTAIVTYYAILFIFYGLYYGILARDVAELCTDRMASTLGLAVSKKKDDGDNDDDVALPSASLNDANMCALCREPLQRNAYQMQRGIPDRFIDDEKERSNRSAPQGEEQNEKIFTLNCKHKFHESCIRGWAIAGKKDQCGVCMEKVQLSDLVKSHPWQKTSLVWSQALDSMRYLMVWNPALLTVAQVFVYFTDR